MSLKLFGFEHVTTVDAVYEDDPRVIVSDDEPCVTDDCLLAAALSRDSNDRSDYK